MAIVNENSCTMITRMTNPNTTNIVADNKIFMARLSTADRYIVRLRNENSNVRSISLAGNDITDESVDTFATTLLGNKSVTYLAMFCLQGGDSIKGSALLAASAMSLSSLRTLSWSNVFENGVAVKILAQGIRSSKSLNRLLLMDSKLKSSDFIALAAALEENTSVDTIGLEGCGVTDEGAVALAKMLKTNKSLRTLSLSGNGITDAGAEELLKSIYDVKDFNSIWKSNHTITSFSRDGSGNEHSSFISPKMQSKINRILDINRSGTNHSDIARHKIALHMEDNFQGKWVDELDQEYIPHVLSWCGRTAGFEILRNMPELLASPPSYEKPKVKHQDAKTSLHGCSRCSTNQDQDTSPVPKVAIKVLKDEKKSAPDDVTEKNVFQLFKSRMNRKVFPLQSLKRRSRR